MPIVTISIALGAHSAEKQGSHQRTFTFHLHILHSLDLDLDLGAPAGGGVEFALPSVRPSARGGNGASYLIAMYL